MADAPVAAKTGKSPDDRPVERKFSKKDEAQKQVTSVAELATRSSDEALKADARRLSIKEGSAYSFMDGFGLRYITPYALALGATNQHIGFLTSIPSFLGNISQLATHTLMERTSRKRIVALGVFLQAFMWLVLLGLGWLFFSGRVGSGAAASGLVALYTVLVLVGAFTGPAWASWMKDVVTTNPGQYFAKRSRIVNAIIIVCMLIAGWTLDMFKGSNLFLGFVMLFGIAFVGRFAGGLLFLRKYEPAFTPRKDAYFSLWSFLRRMRGNNFGRFVLLISLTHFAVNIGGPFIAVYMLRELQFSYVTFTILSMTATITSIVVMPVWGKFADRYGNLTVIKLCLPVIAFIPLFWALSPVVQGLAPGALVPYLLIVESFSGLLWGGFNLVVMNFVYDAVTRERTALCIAYLNVLSGFGVLVGATLGGWVSSLPGTVLLMPPLIAVMVLSGVARLLVFLVLRPFVHEVRDVRKLTLDEMKEKLIHLTPQKMIRLLDLRI